MPRLTNNPIAAVLFLALVAGTALRLRSWRTEAESGMAGIVDDDVSSRRRALRTLGDRMQMYVERMGYEPGTPEYEMRMNTEMQRRRRRMERKELNPESEEESEERQEVLENLRKRTDLWVRGNYRRVGDELIPNTGGRTAEIAAAADLKGEMEQRQIFEAMEEDYQPLTICDRPADVGSIEDFESLQQNAQCPEFTQDKPILLLEGMNAHGRTGNNMIEILHAIQEARDQNFQLGISYNSWAMKLITQMWLAIEGDDWAEQFERAFCVKIFMNSAELEGWDIIHQNTKELFYYRSKTPLGAYMTSQEYSIRTLFRHYNTGNGQDWKGSEVRDMCSGINAVFGEDRANAIYSVIHSRSLEGEPGFRLLRRISSSSGCDAEAALQMEPDYIKSILEPLGMMKYPIAFIWDGQNPQVLDRLMADPDIGPLIRIVPEEASWVGGDITLAVMSNVFIGNPASSFAGFIAKSRLALGFGHNYLFRAKDENGQWRTVCGDHCVFDKNIVGVTS